MRRELLTRPDKTADRVAAEADDATNAATNLADEVKDRNAG